MSTAIIKWASRVYIFFIYIYIHTQTELSREQHGCDHWDPCSALQASACKTSGSSEVAPCTGHSMVELSMMHYARSVSYILNGQSCKVLYHPNPCPNLRSRVKTMSPIAAIQGAVDIRTVLFLSQRWRESMGIMALWAGSTLKTNMYFSKGLSFGSISPHTEIDKSSTMTFQQLLQHEFHVYVFKISWS